MRIEEGFQQTPLRLPLAYTGDAALRPLLERLLPREVFERVDEELKQFEQRLAGPIRDLSSAADLNPSAVEPVLAQYDQWGQRIDTLHTSEPWRALKGIAAEEGLVAIAAEKKDGESSRIHSFAKSYLFVPDGLMVGCPISMTDGCARVLELAGTDEMKREVLPLLCGREASKAWTAGQWMTERPGGSDVSLTETTAIPVDPSSPPSPGFFFLLNGFKWFSSATDGDVALALARTSSSPTSGSKGLSLFLVKLCDERGKSNGVFVHRMKKKFGTKALPTAELELKDAVGQLVGPLGGGVRTISTVLNITRLYSAMHSLGALRRALELAKAFARVRHYGGNLKARLEENPMHTSALVESEVVQQALLHFFFSTARLLGRSEALEAGEGVGKFSEAEQWRLRLTTPVLKSYCAELATSELPRLMEALGGQGYMVENQFPRLIADANVERIWEGTTSVLALDVVRVIVQSKGAAIEHFSRHIRRVLATATSLPCFAILLTTFTSRLYLLDLVGQSILSSPSPSSPSFNHHLPRPLLFLLGHLASTIALIEQAVWSAKPENGRSKEEEETDEFVLERWIKQGAAKETEKALREALYCTGKERKEVERKEREAVYGKSKL
ncbi:hypothetical protein JCM8547_000766 [Rhodosporidiobolus lusitaniae]